MQGIMKIRSKIGVFFCLAFLISCENAPIFEKSYVFENKEWKQNVKPSFIVDIKDATKEYDFVLTLRTTTEYKFSNLWIYMNTQTPNKESARESFEIKITNPDGSWIGKKTGTIVENSLNFKRRKLPLKGKYTFILEQGITDSKIDQVLDIGLVVTEAKKP
jgi:gliding motility-associated lipoprotein GldH